MASWQFLIDHCIPATARVVFPGVDYTPVEDRVTMSRDEARSLDGLDGIRFGLDGTMVVTQKTGRLFAYYVMAMGDDDPGADLVMDEDVE